MTLNCERATFGPTERVIGGGEESVRCGGPTTDIPMPEVTSVSFQALDITSGEPLWRHRTRTDPINTAALTTAGGRRVRRRLRSLCVRL